MKRFAYLICCLFIVNNVFGQTTAAINSETSNELPSHEKALKSIRNNPPLYIVDDKVIGDSLSISYDALTHTDANDIFNISVLKDGNTTALYGEKGINGVIIITTKKYAQIQYQTKLNSISKEYSKYLGKNENNDSDFVYVLDGVTVDNKSTDNKINALYGLLTEKIKRVRCLTQHSEGADNKNLVVVITTKK